MDEKSTKRVSETRGAACGGEVLMSLAPTTPTVSRPAIPREEYAQRRDALRADAREAGLDGIVAWSMGGGTLDRYANVFYLSNHYWPYTVLTDNPPTWRGWGQNALVLPVDGNAILVVDQPDWRTDLVEIDEVTFTRDLYSGVADACRRSGLDGKRLGLADEERMPVTAFKAISSALPSVAFERADELIMARRMVKSPAELDMLRHASLVGGEMMDAMMSAALEGNTDADLVEAAYGVALRLGAAPCDFALASGPEDGHVWWERLPSWNWQRRYERGDFVHPDIYGVVGGYYYDFVRATVVGGEPSPPQREILEAAIGCVHAACAAAVPGNETRDVYLAGRAYLREHGLDHVDVKDGEVDLSTDVLEGFGHGLGLQMEAPWLTPESRTTLVPGMALAVEQHVSRRGVGTVRYEETLIVTDEQPEIMTRNCKPRWWNE
jgi:Xaa-Pro aminopeptidase